MVTITVLLILSGILVGFRNTLSAGGTTVSIALYLAMGIPPQATNAINRVGVLFQNGFASLVFYRKHAVNYKHVLLYALPVMIGAFIGSMTAVKIDEKVFNICFAAVLLIMIVFLCTDRKTDSRQERPFTLQNYFKSFFLFMAAGFYGGFVQAGTGFLLIAVIGSWWGYDLVKTTAAKNTVMFCYTVVAMAVFLLRGGVELRYWLYALIHSAGNVIGSYIATRYALKKGNKFVKIIIICVIIMTALNLLGILDFKIFFKKFIN